MHENVGLGVMSPTEDKKRRALSHATAEDLQDYENVGNSLRRHYTHFPLTRRRASVLHTLN